MEKQILDRIEKPKKRVRVQIILPDAKTWHAHSDEIKAMADRVGGSLAVKMI